MEMIGSANDFAAERIYKAPAVNAFVGSSNRNRAQFALLRSPSRFCPFFFLYPFLILLARFKIPGNINHSGNF